jgi:transposase
MGRRATLTKDEQAKILEHFNSGLTGIEIAALIGTTKNTIMGVINRARQKGLQVRAEPIDQRKMDDKHCQGLLLRCSGKSWPEIKKTIGTSFATTFTAIVEEDMAHDPEARSYWEGNRRD